MRLGREGAVRTKPIGREMRGLVFGVSVWLVHGWGAVATSGSAAVRRPGTRLEIRGSLRVTE
jgi:hypothetical protein